ncbi:hypothetical protein QAD02_018986 [Eretmocerus hayati]|uniref:Uncharacterized protein n=1 Tax=Eretmocerus hayati TaxID=131215 RepID=A0ACC2PKT9_9HYME|nr:hypothetical protein QAD02_018986 [Eretmocerus hayati]
MRPARQNINMTGTGTQTHITTSSIKFLFVDPATEEDILNVEMNRFLSLSSFLLILALADATLSPTDKKAKKQVKEDRKSGPVDKDAFERKLVKQDLKVKDILREAGSYSQNVKRKSFRSGEVLGYITPWNGDGYTNAVKFHGKMDMVSPVWLTINSQNPFNVPTHDIKKSWIHSIKSANRDNHTVKIVPRVLFEGWSQIDIIDFEKDNDKVSHLVDTLNDLADEYHFDGYVLEIWNQFVIAGVKKSIVASMVNSIARGLRESDRDIILAVPPLRGFKKELFTKKDFDSLALYVRYFSLMTYDYSNIQHPGANAPIDWVRKCIETLVPDSKDLKRTQILMGLNFYGYHYTHSGGGPIVGSQYLNLLEHLKGKIQWDDKSQEHFFEVKSPETGYVFYPTAHSIMLRIDLAHELDTGLAIWELGQGLPYFYDLL